jgi:uncharacterized protein (TIGR02246 family)
MKSRTMKNVILAILLQGLFVTSVFAETAEQAVAKAYQNWCSTIAKSKGNPSEMVGFYAPDAILLPTLSPDILFNKEGGGKNEYFTVFTGKKDIKCIPVKLITRMYGDVGVNSGLYDFTFVDAEGKPQEVAARFTFVYEKKDHRWLIVNHHSSILPAASH